MTSVYSLEKHYESDEAPALNPTAYSGDEINDVTTINDDNDIVRYESNAGVASSLGRRLTGADELMAEAQDSDEPLPKMGGGRNYPPPLPNREPYIVTFDGADDPLHPHNWPLSRKIYSCLVLGYASMSIIFGSSMFGNTNPLVMAEFGIGNVTATLTTSLFVFGFASGPILWGPLSELYGRRPILVMCMFLFTCFSFAVATAKDVQTLMLCRFFSGFTGASAVVICPAAFSDMFGPRLRGKAMSVYLMLLFGGPMVSPIIGGFVVKNPHLGWRWVGYIIAITAGSAFLCVLFCQIESHHAVILVGKAETLRRRTANWGIAAPHEEVKLDFKEIVERNIFRPVRMLFREPILLLVSIYNSFIYGLLYLFLTAIPLIFEGKYGFTQGVAELPYLSMFVGILIGGVISVLLEARFVRKLDLHGKIVPEERLPPMMIGSFFFAAGLFWLGWAGNYPDKVHWIVPTVGAAPIGLGLFTIFLPSLNYIIDCYLLYAASALSANTMLRSSFGGIFPLFAEIMFVHMGIEWASTLLGCVAVAMIPVPFLFYKYGKVIRKKSKYTFDIE